MLSISVTNLIAKFLGLFKLLILGVVSKGLR
jgi:hypothetical protein